MDKHLSAGGRTSIKHKKRVSAHFRFNDLNLDNIADPSKEDIEKSLQ